MTLLRKNCSFVGLALVVLLAGFLVHSCSQEETSIKTYTIARDPTWYPNNLMGKEKNMTAFSDDLILSIAKESKFHVHLANSSADALLAGMYAGEYNAIMTEYLPTSLAEETLLFSDLYFFLGPVLITQIDSPYKSIEDMSGKTIGIEQGMSTLFDLQKYPSVVFSSYDNLFKALGALENDKIDGVLIDDFPAQVYVKTFYPNRLKVITPPLTKEGLRLVATKNPSNEKLIQAFNETLKKFLSNGYYDEMIKKWGLVNTMPTEPPSEK